MWLCDVAASSSFLVGCMWETASLLWSVAVSHCWQQMMLLHPCVTQRGCTRVLLWAEEPSSASSETRAVCAPCVTAAGRGDSLRPWALLWFFLFSRRASKSQPKQKRREDVGPKKR